MSMTIDISIGLSIMGLALSTAVFIINMSKASKTDHVHLENRLTTLETRTSFTESDRQCLLDLKAKMNILWSWAESELPKFLKQNDTIEFDKLLLKIEKEGLRSLTNAEFELLDKYINIEYQKALSDERLQDRGTRLSLFKAVVDYSKSHGIIDRC